MSTSDLIAFLSARFDEDEQIAKSAIQGPWHTCGHDEECEAADVIFGTSPIVSNRVVQVANLEVAWQNRENAAHIVRHDPARVLREVEAKRQLLDEAMSIWNSDAEGAGLTILRLLALPHADHQDYREEWRP